MTAALEAGEWSAVRPGRNLPPGKTMYPLYRRLVTHQGRSGGAENLATPAFDPRTYIRNVKQLSTSLSPIETKRIYLVHIRALMSLFSPKNLTNICYIVNRNSTFQHVFNTQEVVLREYWYILWAVKRMRIQIR